MRLTEAITEITKVRWDLLSHNDEWDKNEDQVLADVLFIKALASIEIAIQDLRICQFEIKKNRK